MKARRSPPLANFSLRIGRPADFETLHAIDQLCYTPGIAYTRAELRWYLRLPGAECIVAETRRRAARAHPRVAGFIVTTRRMIHGHIITIDVLERFRRTGVGSALLRRAESRMKKRGVVEVWLETATNNDAVIAFWKMRGYRSHGLLPNYYPGGLAAFVMSKMLGIRAAEEK